MEESMTRDVINAVDTGSAGIEKTFSGDINEEVAAVTGQMLAEISTCSRTLAWVPKPTGGQASLSWIALNISRSTVDRLKNNQSMTCARKVVYNWDRKLHLAGIGL